jgi:hypothetical protein
MNMEDKNMKFDVKKYIDNMFLPRMNMEGKIDIKELLDSVLHYQKLQLFYEFHNNLPKEEYKKIINSITKYGMNNSDILLIICGNSGSGKSFFEKTLITEHPNKFHKLRQVTTRERRSADEDGYEFVSYHVYENLQNNLIAKTHFNKNYYGTIPTYDSSKINTVIASAEAIDDLFKSKELNFIPILIKIIKPYNSICPEGIRKGRNEKFIQKEINDLNKTFNKYKDKCIFTYEFECTDENPYIKYSDIFIDESDDLDAI